MYGTPNNQKRVEAIDLRTMPSELTKFETGATLVESPTVAALGSALYRLLRKLSCMLALFFAVVVLLWTVS